MPPSKFFIGKKFDVRKFELDRFIQRAEQSKMIWQERVHRLDGIEILEKHLFILIWAAASYGFRKTFRWLENAKRLAMAIKPSR